MRDSHPSGLRALPSRQLDRPIELARGDAPGRLPRLIGTSPRLARRVADIEHLGAGDLGALFDRERLGPMQAHVVLGPPRRAEFAEVAKSRLPVVNLAACAYLGLGTDQRIQKAALRAVDRFGPQAGGARPLSGTTGSHFEFESQLARFLHAGATATFTSGYLANISTITSLFGPGDAILLDQCAHRSLYDGAKLSGASVRRFRHNDVRHLGVLLDATSAVDRRLVVVDGAYSMEGDVTPLPEVVAQTQAHGAFLLVDEGHSFGTLGPHGRGAIEHFAVDPEAAHLRTGSLNKALPAAGGFLAADAAVILLLRYTSAGMAFSGALAPASIAAAQAGLEILEHEPERALRVQEKAARLRQALARCGIESMGERSPIVPVLVGDRTRTLAMATALLELGVYVNAIVSPGVRRRTERLRCFVAADHSDADLDFAADAIAEVWRATR